MLSKKQKKVIRDTHIFKYSCTEKNGVPVTYNGSLFLIPSVFEIKNEIFAALRSSGFSKIQQVSPLKANCVIRVFKKLDYHYDETLIYNLFGAYCFARKDGEWSSTGGLGYIPLNHSKQIIKHWLAYDEYIEFDCDFVDFYVKVS